MGKMCRDRSVENTRFDENTCSTVDQEGTVKHLLYLEYIRNNLSTRPDLKSSNRFSIPSSRAFTNRDNIHITESTQQLEPGFVTVASVTPHANFIPNNEVDKFMQYSKEKENK